MAAILKSNMASKHGQNDVYKRGLVQTLKIYPKFDSLLAIQALFQMQKKCPKKLDMDY